MMSLSVYCAAAFCITTVIAAMQNKIRVKGLGLFSKREGLFRTFTLMLPWIFILVFRQHTLFADNISYWENYLHQFTWQDAVNAEKDGGWYVVMMLLQTVISSPRVFFIVIGLFCSIAYGFFYERVTEHRYLAVIAFVALGVWRFQFYGMRQSTAMAFCVFALAFVEKKKLLPFLLLVGIASTIHASAIAFLPVYFVSFAGGSRKRQTLLFIGILLVILFAGNIYTWTQENVADYEHYDIEYSDGGGMIFLLFAAALSLVAETKRKKLVEKNPGLQLYYNLNYIFLALCLLRVELPMLERVKFYYMPVLPVVVAESLGAYYEEDRVGMFMAIGGVGLLLVYLLYTSQGILYDFAW